MSHVSFYWELLDLQDGKEEGKPHEKWTIWNECEDKVDDDAETKSSNILKRIRHLQQLLENVAIQGENAVALFKQQYNDWGMK